jgi:hypothetical protein
VLNRMGLVMCERGDLRGGVSILMRAVSSARLCTDRRALLRCVCMCVCVYACMCLCKHIDARSFVSKIVYRQTSFVEVCMYACMRVCAYVFM